MLESSYDGLYMYSVKVYRNDTEIFSTNMSAGVVDDYTGMDLTSQSVFTETGTYRFKVAAKPLNPYGNYAQSEFAESEEFEFTLPEQKMPAVNNVSVDSDYSTLTFPANDADSYGIIMEYSVSGSDQKISKQIGTEHKNGRSQIRVNIEKDIAEVIKNNDAETICIGVKANSSDLLNCQSSDTTYVPEYKVPVDYFGKKLAELCERLPEKDSDHYPEINTLISELDTYILEMGITTDDMRYSFETRNNTVNNYVSIYAPYCNINGLFDNAKDISDGYFEANGIDLGYIEEDGFEKYNNVRFTGLNFSSTPKETEDAKFQYLVLSEPQKAKTPSKLVYDKSFCFHIGFEGVTDPKKLKYPIRVQFPLPSDIYPSMNEVAVLRINDDDTFSIIPCTVTNKNDITFAEFTIDGEGDYCFAAYDEDSSYDFDYDLKVTHNDLLYYIDSVIDAVINNLFGSGMDGYLDLNSDKIFDMKDLNYLMSVFRDGM